MQLKYSSKGFQLRKTRKFFSGEGKHTLWKNLSLWKTFHFHIFLFLSTLSTLFSPSLSKIQHGSFHFFTSVAEFFFRLSIAHTTLDFFFRWGRKKRENLHGKLLIYGDENSLTAPNDSKNFCYRMANIFDIFYSLFILVSIK